MNFYSNGFEQVLILGDGNCEFSKKFSDLNPYSRIFISDIQNIEDSEKQLNFEENLIYILNKNFKLYEDEKSEYFMFQKSKINENILLGNILNEKKDFSEIQYLYSSGIDAKKLSNYFEIFFKFFIKNSFGFDRIIFNFPYPKTDDNQKGKHQINILEIINPLLSEVSKILKFDGKIEIGFLKIYKSDYIPEKYPLEYFLKEIDWTTIYKKDMYLLQPTFGNSTSFHKNTVPSLELGILLFIKKTNSYLYINYLLESNMNYDGIYPILFDLYNDYLKNKIFRSHYQNIAVKVLKKFNVQIVDNYKKSASGYSDSRIKFYKEIRAFLPVIDIEVLMEYITKDVDPKNDGIFGKNFPFSNRIEILFELLERGKESNIDILREKLQFKKMDNSCLIQLLKQFLENSVFYSLENTLNSYLCSPETNPPDKDIFFNILLNKNK